MYERGVRMKWTVECAKGRSSLVSPQLNISVEHCQAVNSYVGQRGQIGIPWRMPGLVCLGLLLPGSRLSALGSWVVGIEEEME